MPVKHEKKPVKHEKHEKQKPVYIVDVPTMTCTRHDASDGSTTSVPLQGGPENLLVGKFSESEVHVTELSNLMLMADGPGSRKRMKRPAAAEVMKKPAATVAGAEGPPAAEAAEAEEAAGAEEPPAVEAAADGEKDDYNIEYYKGGRNTIGIKARFGLKRHVLCFGGASCTRTETQMREYGKQVVADLHGGMNAPDAKRHGQQLCGLID